MTAMMGELWTGCFQIILLAASLSASSGIPDSSTTCPPGVRPGQFFPDTENLFQIGQGESTRCKSNDVVQADPALKEKCVPWRVGEEASCAYTGLEHGGHWCPLTSAPDPSCAVVQGGNCIDENKCFSDYKYGVCGCSQCPCPVEGQHGTDCGLCTNITGGCDTACQAARGFQPGQRLSCGFGTEFFQAGGAYFLLFPGNIAQPRMEVEIGPGTFDVKVFYSLCTEKEPMLFSVHFEQCENGIKDACKASNLPVPCYLCKTGDVFFPDGTFLDGVVKDLVALTTDSSSMFGCVEKGDQLDCRVSFDGFPFDWGNFMCESGSKCQSKTSAQGMAVMDTGMVNDFGADANFVLYLILGTLAFFGVVAIIVFSAWMYKFKVDESKLFTTGVHLGWQGVCVSDLITDLQGSVDPGAFVAILGPIGAGKSTLLKVLSGRIEATAGEITVNGTKASAKQLRQTVGFVPQEDVCCPDDTVAEAIGFANVMSYGKFPEIHAVLRDKLHQRIGTLSGGQRRMTNIYVELARQPKVLILDEPTTGLDSDSAREITKVLKEISEKIPVLVTMHQPGPDVAGFLSEVFILADGHEVCHAGNHREGKRAVPELQALIEKSGRMPNFKGQNALDVAIDLAFEGVKLQAPLSEMRTSAIIRELDQSTSLAALQRPMPIIPRQLLFMAIRSTKRTLRRAHVNYAATIIASVIIGFCYFQVNDELGGVRNRFGAIFMTHAFLALQAVGATSESTAVSIVTEHEICSYVYLRAVDALVKILGRVASQLPHAVIVSVIVYPMVGLRADGTRPIIFIICITACSVCCSFSAMSARMRSQTFIGRMRACAVNGALLFFCGFLLGNDGVPDLLIWARDSSPLRYSFEMLLGHELIGLRTTFNPVNSRPVRTRGAIYLQQYGMTYILNDEFYALGHMLGVVTCVWMVIAFVALLLPPDAFTCRRTIPVRIKGHGQLELLLEWVSEVVLQNVGSNSPAPPKVSLIGKGITSPPQVAPGDSEESHEHLGDPTFSTNSTIEDTPVMEMQWTGLSNPDVSNLQGVLRTGTLLGILGPCGSGKTTLLTMLTGRVAPSSGKVSVGGKAMSPTQVASMVGYVPQANCLFSEDTFNQALEFALEVAPSTPSSDLPRVRRSKFTKSYLSAGEQRIGILSGGQQRVAAVATELLRRPHMLVLDEPMSGLDAASSLLLANLLKRISQVVPVVITLHQPRPELVMLLTHVMVLHRGVLCVSLPYADLRNLGSDSSQMAEGERPVDQVLETIEDYLKNPVVTEYECQDIPAPCRQHKPLFKIAGALLRRELRRLWVQNPIRWVGQLLMWFFTGLMVALAYSSMEVDTTLGVLQRAGLMFVISCSLALLSLPRVFYFFEVRANVLHELESRVMHSVLYLACHSLADFTHRLICILAFCVPILVVVPLQQDAERRLIFLSTVICVGMASGYLADAVTAFSRDHLSAASIYSGVIIFMLLFGASFIAVDSRQSADGASLHSGSVQIFMHVSVYLYSFQALIENELRGGVFAFDVNDVATGNVDGEAWLENLDVPKRMVGNIFIIIGFGVFYWLIAAFGLYSATWPRRRSAVST